MQDNQNALKTYDAQWTGGMYRLDHYYSVDGESWFSLAQPIHERTAIPSESLSSLYREAGYSVQRVGGPLGGRHL